MDSSHFDAEQRFLSCLTPQLRRQVSALPTVLADHRDRQIVFTARKSVCLADSLRRLRWWAPSGEATSTRALDGDLSLLDGRDVLVVEDIAASGRTIRMTVDRVREAGAADVSVFALSIEGPREQCERALGVTIAEPFLGSSVDESLRHTRSLIDAFAALPMPFNIDWPIYETRRPLAVKRLLETGWTCEGARSSYTRFRPFTLELTREGAELIAPAMPDALARLLSEIELAKLRVYPVIQPVEDEIHAFVVPIAALGSLDSFQIAELGASLGEWIGNDPIAGKTASESYRVLQYLVSTVLIETSLKAAGIRSVTADDAFLPYLFFGPTHDRLPSVLESLRRRARRVAERPRYLVPRRFRMVDGDRSLTTTKATVDERAVADGVLTNTFLRSFLETREYDLRTRIRQPASDEERQEVLSTLARLDRASFSSTELVGALQDNWADGITSLERHPARLVSEFLDRAIDNGEVVPDVFQASDGRVQRRFRAGEVIEFHRDVRAMVETMLHSYRRHSAGVRDERVDVIAPDGEAHVREEPSSPDGTPIGGDEVQKLLVGYTRYMIEQNQRTDLRSYPATSESVDHVQLRYHMRGAVMTSVDPDFVADAGDPSSLSVLVDDGVLKEIVTSTRARRERRYRLSNEAVMGDPPPAFAHGAELFGEVIAKLRQVTDPRDERGALLFDDHAFARLVSLVSADDQILALGADIEIAMNFIASDIQFSGPNAIRTSALAEAINQGLAKAGWCLEHKGAERLRIAQGVLSGPERPGPRAVASVLSCLSPGDTQSPHHALIRDEAAWLADAYRYLLALEWLVGSGAADPARKPATMAKALNNDALLSAAKAKPRPSDDPRGRLRKLLETHANERTVPDRTELAATIGSAVEQLVEDGRKLIRRCHRINALNQLQTSGRRRLIENCLMSKDVRIRKRDGLTVHALDESQIGTSLSGFETLARLEGLSDPRQLLDLIAEIRRGGNSEPMVIMLALPAEFAPATSDDFDTIEVRGSFTRLLEAVSPLAKRRRAEVIVVKTVRGNPPLIEGLRFRRDRVEFDVLGETWEALALASTQGGTRSRQEVAGAESREDLPSSAPPAAAQPPVQGPLVGHAGNVFIGGTNMILQASDDRARVREELIILRDCLKEDADAWEVIDAGSRAEVVESVETLGEAIAALDVGDEAAFEEQMGRLRKTRRWLGEYSTAVVSQVTASVISKALHLG